MASRLTLYLDLGDLMTKGIATGAKLRDRFRFPSVVARELLRDRTAAVGGLLLDESKQLPRLADFDARQYPRARSFPGGTEFVSKVSALPTVRGARFAGWLAAGYGLDRELLALAPTADNIDALVHKAVLVAGTGDEGRAEVAVTLVIDLGPKSTALQEYAVAGPHRSTIAVRSYRSFEPRRVEMSVRAQIVDAAACAYRGVPLAWRETGRVLVADIGYLRTKLSIVSREGCEAQTECDGLGAADCVRRVLRDAQEQGLVEDELAVIRALERGRGGTIEVEGRTFDVRAALTAAQQALGQEVAQAVARFVSERFRLAGTSCRRVALIGGGAALAGACVVAELARLDLGLESWVAERPAFLLVEGARGLAGGELP